MSKKHSGSSRPSQNKNRKRPQDPDFAGKKAIKGLNLDKQNSKTKKINEVKNGSNTDTIDSEDKPLSREKHLGEKAVSANSLHNKDVQKQTAAKKQIVEIPDELKTTVKAVGDKGDSGADDAAEEIIVKTIKSSKKSARKSNLAQKTAKKMYKAPKPDEKVELESENNPRQETKKAQRQDPEVQGEKEQKTDSIKNKSKTSQPKTTKKSDGQQKKSGDLKVKIPVAAQAPVAIKPSATRMTKYPQKVRKFGQKIAGTRDKKDGRDARDEKIEEKTKFDWRKTWRKHPMPAILRIPCAILLLAGASILITWFILWRTSSCDASQVADFIGKKPMLFSYSCLIIFFLMAICAAVTWHIFFTIGLSFATASVITFISIQKYQLREEPLLPSDFVFAGQTGNLISMVDASAVWRLVFGVVLIIIGSILLEVYACKMLGKRMKKHPFWERHVLIPRATFAAIAVTGLTMTAAPILRHENPEWLEELTTVGWIQTKTFGYNGFIIDFVSNIQKTAAEKPHNYSRETMMKIAEKYWAIKEADEENRKPLNEIADRIYIVLNESFYDPSIVKDHYDYGKKDVLPNVHKVFENYPSGYMYSPGYGGSTANIEFEVQTGYSNYWANSYPYIDVVGKSDSFLSVASWAKKYGFNTEAIHAYWGEMYNRDGAYPILGYDEFIDMDGMSIRRYEPGTAWPNDNAIFDEILDLTDGNSPVLANVVTMQNHGGYEGQNYPKYDFVVTNGERKDEMTKYFQLLNSSDKYIDEFLEDLKKTKEKSVVLLFGDHAAGILPELAEAEDKSTRDLSRLTPYFIWANFDLGSDSKKKISDVAEQNQKLGFDFSKIKGVDLPTTTPNCLLNQLYNTLGAEKPAMFYLLDSVCEETPIITGSFYEDGKVPDNNEAIKEYELVNYDVMNGQRYWDGD